MPFCSIEIINGSFISSDEGADYADVLDAKQTAIDAAAAIAITELRDSKPSVVVQASVRDEQGKTLAKLAVAICVGDLHIDNDC